ncbi:hypothetical protein SAMN05216179_0056 [Gracilibacillus kekensis]|uniref:Integral membrane protein n=1 Tax=Gracilibacillus kekensis TaxID=1027249 RepID=A0A1M7IIF6_9BACI|nr:hypothetical protein SAMN05216179_0056 [Gracilibacillus kekensis]
MRVDILIDFQWEIFIVIEIISFISLLLFGVFRYFFGNKSISTLFISTFLLLVVVEALLGIAIYQYTGEFSTFQMVLLIFVVYACTFGIVDFKKLDRWMRRKIGGWRGVDLLTAKDYKIIEQNQDPKYVAKVNRNSAMIHLVVFVIAQGIFWMMGLDTWDEAMYYLTDFSWFETGNYQDSPYPNETLYSIGTLWAVIFAIDFLYSWSYTIFPSSK